MISGRWRSLRCFTSSLRGSMSFLYNNQDSGFWELDEACDEVSQAKQNSITEFT